MNKYIKLFLDIFLPILFWYGIFGFISWSWNIGEWSGWARLLFILLTCYSWVGKR